jgi:hypothetical protein
MKGRKGSLDEGGLRVPFLIRWFGHIRARARIPQIAGAIDLLPTLADLAGITISDGKQLDGTSLKPLLTQPATDWPERTLFSMHNKRASARTQRYRLDPAGQLFDIAADPGQTRNIASEQPRVAARLQSALEPWRQEMLPLVGEDDRPFPVGFAENTMLPARDGVPHGGIERSSRHPNCSFFRNWTGKEDSITWDIETAGTGRYELTLHYTCPASDIGSTIELSFLSARIRVEINEPYDPPLQGETQDLAPRTESYVKNFRPLRVGAVELEKGRGLLTLRALEIPGKQVADVRYVGVRRLS